MLREIFRNRSGNTFRPEFSHPCAFRRCFSLFISCPSSFLTFRRFRSVERRRTCAEMETEKRMANLFPSHWLKQRPVDSSNLFTDCFHVCLSCLSRFNRWSRRSGFSTCRYYRSREEFWTDDSKLPVLWWSWRNKHVNSTTVSYSWLNR